MMSAHKTESGSTPNHCAPQPQVVLASGSPRRAELLNQLRIAFQQIAVNVDESLRPDEAVENYVLRLASDKARAGWCLSKQQLPVIGADTVCVLDGQVLQKPRDQSDAQQMLGAMSGRTHQVLTAVCVVQGERQQQAVVTTQVTFKTLSQTEIEWYWHSGEPRDKAGSYGIQGLGGQFVKSIQGSYSAVVGLPLYETSTMLKQLAVEGLPK